MVKVTKQSSNKGKRKAQSYSTLRFSATKGFDSSQAKITQAFKRVDKSNATAAVVDPPNSSDQGEPSINSNQEECSDQNMAYNQPSGVSISRTDVISTIQEETPNININTSAMENISTQDMEVVEEESLVIEEPEEDAEYQEAEDNDVIEDLPVNSKHKAFFESIHARLRNNGCPVEYDRKTFWVEPVDAYFAMKNKIDPSESLYQPRVFLWLPHHLLPFKFQSLRCPKCKASVKGKGFNKDPHARRIVDLTSCFYLMSYRYECSVTGCKKEGFEDSWQSYDPVIMHQLPQELQMEFPAILTRKGGVSKTVANLLRPCMQNSMGPQRFQKLLRELHVLRHDELELQYLLSQLGKKKGFLKNSNQYAGYVPGAIYFRTLYTAIIDELKPKMEKHAMLLDGKVLKCDHSFKFPKHIAKIEDAGVFTALFTVTNEYEEIVHQALMKEAYELYGHQMPVAFFTDNVQSDKRFLEGIFESLKVTQEEARQQETTSVSASPSFLRLPDDVQMEYINRNVGLIVEKMKDLYDKLAVERNAGKPSVIGLDTEWNDSEDPRHDQVDVIQIAHGNTVSVIHIDRSWSTLPKELVDVLVNVDITKVGRSVGVDFSRLNNRFGIEFKTKLELGSFCSARQLISNGTMSLSDISLSVLGAPLDKGPQRSPWNMDDLSPDLLNYAAIDAWAGLAIYNVAVNHQPVGTGVSPTSPVGLFVDVKPPRNSQAVAHGEIIVNDSAATVKITKVNVPGYLANGVALQAYGAPPFELKVSVAHLVTALPPSEVSSSSPVNPAATYNPLVATPVSSPNTILESEIQTKMQEIFGDALDRVDKAGFINGYRKFAWYNADPNIAFTRVVKDIFHLMDMIKPYKRHTLYKQFTRKFNDSLFTID
ncbi:hypothetical protein V8B55DRAFT_1560346 [Mucor lusitanicus]